jgi:uncharacterized protein (UPF0261 family)
VNGYGKQRLPGGPEANEALFESLKSNLRPDKAVVELDCDINDPPFAQCCGETLLRLMQCPK